MNLKPVALIALAFAAFAARAADAPVPQNVLSLQASARTNAIAIRTTDLHAKQVNLTAHTIGIGTSSPVANVTSRFFRLFWRAPTMRISDVMP